MHDMKMLSPVKIINKKRRLHFACKDESGRPLFSSSSFQEPSAYLGKKSFVWTQEEKKFYPPTPSFSAEATFMSVVHFILRKFIFWKLSQKHHLCDSPPEYCQFGGKIFENKFRVNTDGEEVLSSNSILLSWSNSYECGSFHSEGSLFFES